ncbi:hypothetical protein [Algoriphagus machipongonensis]|uniref:Uncharacterized protein n=1 Tax=Algoriphagus machipongonensis TaxID=388413 RepID=A3HXX3_9BACT|nr:hypothetical protein [Algoriphagus machipongonensis]EAZ81446.1 hypothetical protein ALPR1_20458 [Algoriphagus machipongonensis]
MIFTDKHIDQRKIDRLLGKPISVDFKRPVAIGSPGLFLKSFIDKTGKTDSIAANSKCNFEKRENGLLLHSNINNQRTLIPIHKAEIVKVELIRGTENIEPIPLFPMWILLKMGVSVLYARYFRIYVSEYSIDEMKLKIKTTDHDMDFIANGYLFEKQLDFFKECNLGNKLKIKPAPNKT